MSEITNVENGSNFQHNQYDTSIIFLRDNKYKVESYNNTTYSAVTLTAGTVMGRVAASNYVQPCDADNSDGSEYPIGILAEDITIAASSSGNVPICIEGEVAEEKVNFDDPDDTLETIISTDGNSRRYKDLLADKGIVLVAGTEQSEYDNE